MYLFRFLRDFWLIVPILIPFYRSHSLTNTEIFTVQAIFSFSLLLWEIPSGYFSDVLGRKPTLVLGSACLPIGLTIYAFSSSFAAFAIAESILGLGFAMCSGTESALIYDTLLGTGKKKSYHHTEGKAEFITRIGSTVASILGGACAVLSLFLPFYINIVSGLLMVMIALSFIEPSRKRPAHKHVLSGIMHVVLYSLKHPQIFSLIVLYAAVLTTGLLGIWSYLIKLQSFDLPLMVNGTGFAVFQVSSAIGALTSHRISRYLGIHRSFRLLLVIPLVLFMCSMPLPAWALTITFIHAFIWGFSLPFFLERINRLITSDIRATVLSTGSMAGRVLFVCMAPVLGAVTDHIGPGIGYITLGVLFLGLYSVSRYLAEQ